MVNGHQPYGKIVGIHHTNEEIMKWYNREQVMDREEIQLLIICVDQQDDSSSEDNFSD